MKVRQRNMGTGSTREPGGQWSKHRVERKRGRMMVNEREGRRVTGAGWALASQTCTMIPVQEQIGQFFMACPLAASSISAFYIYFQISDCRKHSSRLKRQLRNSGLDPAHVHTQPALSQIADLNLFVRIWAVLGSVDIQGFFKSLLKYTKIHVDMLNLKIIKCRSFH